MKHALLLVLGCIATLYASDLTRDDRNFAVAKVNGNSIVWHDALAAPFELSGFPWHRPGAPLHRLPAGLRPPSVNAGAVSQARTAAGGAIRFTTNSPRIAIRAEYTLFQDLNHQPRTGACGLELQQLGQDGKYHFFGIVQPDDDNGNKPLEQLFRPPPIWKPDGAAHTYLLWMPTYAGLRRLSIGLAPGSTLQPPPPHRIPRPILFYGSSTTQGACASRPGNCYPARLGSALDAPIINLGFSGSDRGEPALAQAIADLDLSAFVYDYNYNTTDDYFEATHEPFFRIIREARPNLPIIILLRYSGGLSARRRAIAERTWRNALARGDRRVWFVDGMAALSAVGMEFCTVDHYHPNDLGFHLLAEALRPVLEAALATQSP